jgi:DUF4097 and DUF4098 domain-containing protein YvlB
MTMRSVPCVLALLACSYGHAQTPPPAPPKPVEQTPPAGRQEAPKPAPREAPKPAAAPIVPYSERFSRQFAFYPGGKIAIAAGASGTVKVIGWKLAAVRVEAEKIVYQADSPETRKLADQFPISVRYAATSATIQFRAPVQPTAEAEVNGTIYVPAMRTDLKVQLIKGDFAIGGVAGWIEVNTEDGSIEATALQGYFSGMTKHGDITVEMSGPRWEGHGFTAATRHGGIGLLLPQIYSAALQMETQDGTITIDYPEQEVEGEKVPLTAVAHKNGRSLKASVGEGGAPIRLSTAAGDIRLGIAKSP